ncbi:MAG: hypothetical protein ABIR70_21515 [Bryobacteraceae bacterium]
MQSNQWEEVLSIPIETLRFDRGLQNRGTGFKTGERRLALPSSISIALLVLPTWFWQQNVRLVIGKSGQSK